MPFSYDYFDNYMRDLVGMLRPASVLDIGPGAGKYGTIVREVMARNKFSCRLSTIEIDKTYVEKYELKNIYDDVGLGSAVALIMQPKIRFDFIIMGDVIEHMRKSQAVDLLNFLIYRSGYICIIYPHEFQQDDWEGHLGEAHISTWSMRDFDGWNTLHREWRGIHLFLIKGFLPTNMIITG